MTTGTPATVARKFQTSQTHYIRKTVNWNDAGIATGLILGVLPETAQITYIHINVTTAFNAATTNVLAAGTTGTGTQVFGTADAVAGTLGSKIPNAAGMAIAPLTTDTIIYVSYTQTGAAATAGVATVTIEYVVNNG